jgi:hypothetical protein
MPRRVIDGIGSETVRRRLWCVVVASLAADAVTALVELLTAHGRDVALLANEPAGPTEYRSVAEACDQLGVTAADAVIVCSDPAGHAAGFPSHGARLLTIGASRPARGALAVADLAELRDLFAERGNYRAASTYHEA